jgi:hypothetical protein
LREWLPRNETRCGPKQRRRDGAFVIFHAPAEAHTRGRVPPTQRSALETLDFISQPFAHQLFVFVTRLFSLRPRRLCEASSSPHRTTRLHPVFVFAQPAVLRASSRTFNLGPCNNRSRAADFKRPAEPFTRQLRHIAATECWSASYRSSHSFPNSSLRASF